MRITVHFVNNFQKEVLFVMGFLKKSCAVVLASAMALGIMPGMNLKAAEAPDTDRKSVV